MSRILLTLTEDQAVEGIRLEAHTLDCSYCTAVAAVEVPDGSRVLGLRTKTYPRVNSGKIRGVAGLNLPPGLWAKVKSSKFPEDEGEFMSCGLALLTVVAPRWVTNRFV